MTRASRTDIRILNEGSCISIGNRPALWPVVSFFGEVCRVAGYSNPPGTAQQSRGVLFLSFAQWYLLVRQPFIPDQYTQHVSHIPAKQLGLAGLPQPLAHFLLQAVMQKIIATAIKSTENFLTFILFLLFLFLNSKMAIRINEYHCHKHDRFPLRQQAVSILFYLSFHAMLRTRTSL